MESLRERLTIPELLAYAGKYLFDKGITDAAGGNISMRAGDTIYMTPTFAGTQYHWTIGAEDITIGSMNDLEGLKNHPRFTREGFSHLEIYQAFPYVGAVIHAHPKYINPFIVRSKPIPAMLRSSRQFGTLQYHEEAEAYSQDQAEKIVKVLKTQEDRMKKKAAGVLMPRHGIIIASKDIMTALDSIERMNNNAFAVLMQKMLD